MTKLCLATGIYAPAYWVRKVWLSGPRFRVYRSEKLGYPILVGEIVHEFSELLGIEPWLRRKVGNPANACLR